MSDDVRANYDYLFNLTDNFTSNASALAHLESLLEPSYRLNLTAVVLQLAPVYSILHEPYIHPSCESNVTLTPVCGTCQRHLHHDGKAMEFSI